MKIRFRRDGWHYADLKAAGWTFDGDGERCYGKILSDPKEQEARQAWDSTPSPEPGDIWRIHWHHTGSECGPIAGYAICCPGCGRIHTWTTATNCSQKFEKSYCDKDGKEVKYWSCAHQGVGSCWTWTGSAEEGTLSASPSLLVLKDRNELGCGWHGWLRNGELVGV